MWPTWDCSKNKEEWVSRAGTQAWSSALSFHLKSGEEIGKSPVVVGVLLASQHSGDWGRRSMGFRLACTTKGVWHQKLEKMLGVVVHTFNPSPWEAAADGSRSTWSMEWVLGQPELHWETLSQKRKKGRKEGRKEERKEGRKEGNLQTNETASLFL